MEAEFHPRDWRAVGLELGVKDSVLSTVEADYNHAEERLREMVSRWLRSDVKSSWEKLASAVGKKYGEATAQNIRVKAGIGMP